MGSPISPIISNLYMENFERVALSTFDGIGPSKWYRYVDDTWVLIKASELDRFFNHINQVDPNIKFTQEGLSDNKLAFLDCLVHVEEDLSLSVSVYRKQTHTDQYLQFDSNHPLIQKLGVVKTLIHRAETIVTKESEKKAEQDHLRKALHHCGFKNWAIDKALNSGGKDGKEPTKHSNSNSGRTASATIPYHGDLSEKLKRIFREYNITTHFKPVNTIRQALVHPKDKQPKCRQSGLVYGIQCAESFNCTDTYIGETSQPLKKRLQQHQRSSATLRSPISHPDTQTVLTTEDEGTQPTYNTPLSESKSTGGTTVTQDDSTTLVSLTESSDEEITHESTTPISPAEITTLEVTSMFSTGLYTTTTYNDSPTETMNTPSESPCMYIDPAASTRPCNCTYPPPTFNITELSKRNGSTTEILTTMTQLTTLTTPAESPSIGSITKTLTTLSQITTPISPDESTTGEEVTRPESATPVSPTKSTTGVEELTRPKSTNPVSPAESTTRREFLYTPVIVLLNQHESTTPDIPAESTTEEEVTQPESTTSVSPAKSTTGEDITQPEFNTSVSPAESYTGGDVTHRGSTITVSPAESTTGKVVIQPESTTPVSPADLTTGEEVTKPESPTPFSHAESTTEKEVTQPESNTRVSPTESTTGEEVTQPEFTTPINPTESTTEEEVTHSDSITATNTAAPITLEVTGGLTSASSTQVPTIIYEAWLEVYHKELQVVWPCNIPADGFHIEYKLHETDIWNDTYSEAHETTATLKDLTPNSKYEVHISTRHNVSTVIPPTGTPTTDAPTTTGPSVSDPIIYDSSILASNTNLQVSWSWPIERPVDRFQIEYRLSGTDTWNVIYAEENKRMVSLEGLTSGWYDVRISIIKGSD
ncbi:uncharacterized protein [Amphiura filiformis]|uniref:uncharacterized protein n=1 Tax=Amphiura filiformis TaxID=82378 RepID=UPI003B21A0E6